MKRAHVPNTRASSRPEPVAVEPTLNGVHLNVEVHGPADATTVVLIHGWTCSSIYGTRHSDTLRPELRVVVYDQRGHGAERHTRPGPLRVQALVDDITPVLDATLDDRNRARGGLAGHSMAA